jgi:hypothetical protein
MKFLVCNVFGMALGVTCLALILNRPSAADEEKAAQEQAQVIVVQSDDETADVADALKKVLHGKLDGLPAEIQEKIRQKLEAVKGARDSKKVAKSEQRTISARVLELKGGETGQQIVVRVDPKAGDDKAPEVGKKVQMKVIVVGSDGEAGTVGQSASQEQQTATVVAEAFPDGECKHVVVAVAGKEVSGDAKEKTLDIDVDTDSHHVVGEAHVVVDGAAASKAEAAERTYQVTIAGDEDAQSAEGVHKIQVRALKAKPGQGKPKFEVFAVAPGTPMPHMVHLQPQQTAKANADVAKRLKGIESELKQIRKLLEEMR